MSGLPVPETAAVEERGITRTTDYTDDTDIVVVSKRQAGSEVTLAESHCIFIREISPDSCEVGIRGQSSSFALQLPQIGVASLLLDIAS